VHSFHDEWVYNGADIDGSKVVWARDLGPEQNAKLMTYFQDRNVWIVKAGIESAPLGARFAEDLHADTEFGQISRALYPIVLRKDSRALTPPQTGRGKSPRRPASENGRWVQRAVRWSTAVRESLHPPQSRRPSHSLRL